MPPIDEPKWNLNEQIKVSFDTASESSGKKIEGWTFIGQQWLSWKLFVKIKSRFSLNKIKSCIEKRKSATYRSPPRPPDPKDSPGKTATAPSIAVQNQEENYHCKKIPAKSCSNNQRSLSNCHWNTKPSPWNSKENHSNKAHQKNTHTQDQWNTAKV